VLGSPRQHDTICAYFHNAQRCDLPSSSQLEGSTLRVGQTQGANTGGGVGRRVIPLYLPALVLG